MSQPALEPGAKLGRYRLVERLAPGGMGVVFRAWDDRLVRDVAIKVLPAEAVADPTARARMLREARSVAALNHPRICVVYEVDVDAGRDFIVMEWVDGRPLDRMVRAGGLPESEVARIGAEIADALAHAHGRGVIHRDLKCANVVLRSDGGVKVLDFGLARRVPTPDGSTLGSRVVPLTGPGAIVGTVHYMAPEILYGAEADARSDIWALGVMLQELVSGCRPFDGQTEPEVTGAIMHLPPRPLPETVSAGLRAIITRCLEKDTARRFQSVGEVESLLKVAGMSGEAALADGATAPSRPDSAASADEPDRPPIPGRRIALGLLAGLLVAAGLFGVPGVRRQLESLVGLTPHIPVLAVMPLGNASPDSTQTYFANGMTDAIANQLTKVAALRVIAPGAVASLARQHKSLAEIGRELHAPVLLRGSVEGDSLRVRIALQLLNTQTRDTLWTESFDRSQSEAQSLPSVVALAIAKRLQVPLTDQEKPRLGSAATVDPEAYRAYLRAREAETMGGMTTLERNQEAERLYRRAIDLAPDYAPAWMGIAHVAYNMSSLYLAPNIAIPKARAAADKALALDPNLADAHTMFGIVKRVYDWDWAGAEKEFDRAIVLQPGDASAYEQRGLLQMSQGRFDAALASIRQAAQRDPLAGGAALGWSLPDMGRLDEGIQQLHALITVNPDEHGWYVSLGLAMVEKGNLVEGIASIEKGVAMYADNDDLWQLAYAYGKAGRKKDVERVIARLLQRRQEGFVPAMSLANAYASLGDRDEAFRWLDLAFEDHSEQLIYLKIRRPWDPLRSDPRYDRALRRLHLLP